MTKYDEVREQATKGNHAVAFKLAMSDINDSNCLYFIGNAYEKGEGVSKSISDAIIWFERAANKGNIRASEHLAEIYHAGEVISKDIQKAIYWYEMSAGAGCARTSCTLGKMYYYGIEVKQNFSLAAKYLLDSCSGLVFDQDRDFLLGVLHERGLGVTEDKKKARSYYTSAADVFGNTNAALNLGILYLEGKGGPKDYSLALKYFSKAANKNNAGALNNLGAMYLDGKGVKRDKKQAAEFFKKAAALGSEEAKKNLENMSLKTGHFFHFIVDEVTDYFSDKISDLLSPH